MNDVFNRNHSRIPEGMPTFYNRSKFLKFSKYVENSQTFLKDRKLSHNT